MGSLTVAITIVATSGCGGGSQPPTPVRDAGSIAAPAPTQDISEVSTDRDLSADESMGGHTLARHVAKTDEELATRLRNEPQISSASTYTDRATAERVVGAALASAGRPFQTWRARTGNRPNFVLHYRTGHSIGRSVSRGRSGATHCENAIVVLRWNDRHQRFYVLTSYPEERR